MDKKRLNHLLYFWLSVCRVTPRRLNKLLEIYEIEELFDRVKKDTKIEDLVGKEKYALLTKSANFDLLQKTYDGLYEYGIKFLAQCDDEFQGRLKQKEVSPPIGIYYKGDISLIMDDKPSVGIVGTRRSSSYGRDMAVKFAAELSGYQIKIVSGLATGIDAYSHDSCLKSDGKAIAVLGMGHNKFGPADNIKLYSRICESGLVISEYTPNFEATKYTFPERNRLIAALSDAVIIIEAAKQSGGLITADFALEQGKEVFAVPGNITSAKSQGTNKLIQSGANMLLETQDVLNFFNLKNTKLGKENCQIKLDFYETSVYNLLQIESLSVDELEDKTDFSVPELLTILFSLEMKNAVKKMEGNKYRIIN